MDDEMSKTPEKNSLSFSSGYSALDEERGSMEVVYGMIIAYNAFSRWLTRCMAAAGKHELTPLEVLVLHNTNHHERDKRLTDICFLLNIEDTHTVNYALRKLMGMDLLVSEKRGKEVFYRTSSAGAELCEAYREVRDRCFLDSLRQLDITGEELRDIAAILRALSGQHDQASRAAASL